MSTENSRKHLDIDSDTEEQTDFLEVDAPLPGQNYVCLSFVTPTKIIAQKNEYYSYNFYKHQFELFKQIMRHEFNKLSETSNQEGFVHKDALINLGNTLDNFASSVKLTDINNKCLQEQSENEARKLKEELERATSAGEQPKNITSSLPETKIEKYVSFSEFEDYNEEVSNYKYTDEDRMQDEFNERVEFQTNMFGVKVRGTFESYKEAKLRAKILQKKDKSFNVWVGQVGYWLPVDADPDKAQNSEYMDSQLNGIVKQYKENERKRDYFYQQRAEEEKKEASIRNKKNRQEKEKLQHNQQELQSNTEPPTPQFNEYGEPIQQFNENSEPTETLNVNRIEELLKERREEMSSSDVIKNEANVLFQNGVSAEAQQAGFGGLDPWMVRKMAEKNKKKNNSDEEDSEDDDETDG